VAAQHIDSAVIFEISRQRSNQSVIAKQIRLSGSGVFLVNAVRLQIDFVYLIVAPLRNLRICNKYDPSSLSLSFFPMVSIWQKAIGRGFSGGRSR